MMNAKTYVSCLMKNSQEPSATWDEMNDQQKIEWLATFIGWHKDGRYWINSNGFTMAICEKPNMTQLEYFDPLTDWNHWREVEQRIMSGTISVEYYKQLTRKADTAMDVFWIATNADLPTRAKAIYLALQ